MAIQNPVAPPPLLAGSASPEGQRLLALPGVVAIICASIVAAVSFVILFGVTPITPNEEATLALIAINAGFVLLLIALIGREIHRILMARRRGRAEPRRPVR